MAPLGHHGLKGNALEISMCVIYVKHHLSNSTKTLYWSMDDSLCIVYRTKWYEFADIQNLIQYISIIWPMSYNMSSNECIVFHKRRDGNKNISYCICSCSHFYPHGLSGRTGIVVACVCPSVRPSVRSSVRPPVYLSVRKLYVVRTITRHTFELESPNLRQTCIMGYSWLVLKIGVIDLDLQGHFGHFDSEL